jgi:hypothetical protein
MSQIRRFKFRAPPGAQLDFATLVMRELTNADRPTISLRAQRTIQPALADNGTMQIMQEQYEAQRLSLCEVDGHVIHDTVPFDEFDAWSVRSMRYVQAFFAKVNGVREDALEGALLGAEEISALPPPAGGDALSGLLVNVSGTNGSVSPGTSADSPGPNTSASPGQTPGR